MSFTDKKFYLHKYIGHNVQDNFHFHFAQLGLEANQLHFKNLFHFSGTFLTCVFLKHRFTLNCQGTMIVMNSDVLVL